MVRRRGAVWSETLANMLGFDSRGRFASKSEAANDSLDVLWNLIFQSEVVEQRFRAQVLTHHEH
jgi:hypothetical protein